EAFREADMVDVCVGEYKRSNVGERAMHLGQLIRQVVPVTGRAGVDDRDLAAFLKQVCVDEARADALDTGSDLHRLRFGSAVAATVSSAHASRCFSARARSCLRAADGVVIRECPRGAYRSGVVVSPENFPNPELDERVPSTGDEAVAVLAGGCFWCVEAVYKQLDGVKAVTSGYAGGTKETADYDVVSSGRTGHAEAVEVRFDPAKVSYGQLLKVFFSIAHDPTTRDRQGPDVGKQYRSAIFYANDAQRRVAEAYIAQID